MSDCSMYVLPVARLTGLLATAGPPLAHVGQGSEGAGDQQVGNITLQISRMVISTTQLKNPIPGSPQRGQYCVCVTHALIGSNWADALKDRANTETTNTQETVRIRRITITSIHRAQLIDAKNSRTPPWHTTARVSSPEVTQRRRKPLASTLRRHLRKAGKRSLANIQRGSHS